MATSACGCRKEPCGCCEGTRKLTPISTDNRPGLDSLSYRVGTHGSFLETMKAELGAVTIDMLAAAGLTVEHIRPLQGLTTRSSSDPTIALLDGWAAVGDVLTFYQERLANEGFLRTATERRSVLELARLVGYAPRPGVAATAYLAYTIEEKQAEPVEIPVGSRSQTIPGPNELPQAFETSEKLVARSAWNNLQVRLHQPQHITLDNALTIERVYVAGTATRLTPGDLLLFVFSDKGDQSVVRTVAAVEQQAVEQQIESARTMLSLVPVDVDLAKAAVAIRGFVEGVKAVSDPTAEKAQILLGVQRILRQVQLGEPITFEKVKVLLQRATDHPQAAYTKLVTALRETLGLPTSTNPPGTAAMPALADIISGLLKRSLKPQIGNSLQLSRTLSSALQAGADVQPQLLVNFAPRLADSFYLAWANAIGSPGPAELKAVYAMRTQAKLFGAGVAKQPIYKANGQLDVPENWQEWDLDSERSDTLFLDQAYPEISGPSFVLIQQGTGVLSREVRQVHAATRTQRTAYGQSGSSTMIKLIGSGKQVVTSMDLLRSTLVYANSDPLTLTDEPTTPEDVGDSEIPLDRLYSELTSGRWVIFSGERADIQGVSGVQASELLMISGIRQDLDPALPGDKVRSTLLLATPTVYRYRRDSLKIFGNVVKATHGETRNETLGAGDGSKELQAFSLKQAPLTFVAAPNPAGVDSTLKVYVNDVEWHETEMLAGLGPRDRNFITRTNDDGVTTVVFGTGATGARLPTGVANVKATYRSGIGAAGNARPEQINLLQTRPLGVKGVINPLRASGGADRDSRDQVRANAPLAVMSLDRLVSVADYADFSRTFAGIGKARAQKISNGREQLVHVTIAGVDDIPIDPVSDVYRTLLVTLGKLGDPGLAIQVDPRELKVLVLSAKVRLAPDYQWEPVVTALRAALLQHFGFQERELGQPVFLSDIESRMQALPGVVYVDVDAFGGIPERVADPNTGVRQLLTLDEMTKAARDIVSAPDPEDRVNVNLADVEFGVVRPAQLAMFSSAVPDTLILNQIS